MVETQQLLWVPALNRWQEQLISTLNTASILDQSVYVSKTGSDDLGSGAPGNPYATISFALSVIDGANENTRHAIYVAPGEYSEPWKIKPWVAIIGAFAGSNGVSPDGAMLVEITAPADSLGFSSDWDHSGYSVGFMSGLGFQNHQTWDQAADGYSKQPQLNFYDCSFNSGVSFLGPGNVGFDNVMLDGCLLYGGITVKGWQLLWTRNCTFLGGAINVDSGPIGSNEDTTWLSQNSSIGAALSPTNVVVFNDGYSSHFAKADLSNSDIVGDVLLDGVRTSFHSTSDGYFSPATLINGAPAAVFAQSGSASSSSSNYALFFAKMPGDNSATVAVGAAVEFPQNGPANGNIIRLGPSTFNLPSVGAYEVSWQVSVSEPGQLQLALGGVGLSDTVVGRASGTSQLVGSTVIMTSSANSVLSLINPLGNSTALTITPIAGGANSVSATLMIKAL
jgi:hypothetical protein